MKDLIERLRRHADSIDLNGEIFLPTLEEETRSLLAREAREAADALERFRWIPVSQQPEAEREYLTLVDGKNCALDFWEQGGGWWGNGNRVTHWMHTPEAPE